VKAIFLFHDEMLPLITWWKWYWLRYWLRYWPGPVQDSGAFGDRMGAAVATREDLAGFHMLYDRRPNFPKDSIAAEGTFDLRSHG